MTDSTHPIKGPHWTVAQKIAFRFFFVFLSLQVLTESFLGVLFRDDNYKIWNSIAERFTQPCLWLNDHIFHFKYIPSVYSSFTGSLNTIRDIVYLLVAALACAVWTMADRKRPGYDKLYYWFSRCLIIMLSAAIFFYGIIKVFPIQMSPPSFVDLQKQVGELSPFRLAWMTFGYGQPYQVFMGVFELAGAILILFRRTRVAGLLIITAVLTNVIMIDYTYVLGEILITAFYMLLITLFLLAPYAFHLSRFFFTQQPAALVRGGHIPSDNFKTKLFTIVTILFLGSTFTSNALHAYGRYTKREATNRSAQYSLIKNHIVDGDTLKPIENDTLRWRSWFERIRAGKRLVTINTMKSGADKTYMIERDSARHMLLLRPLKGDSALLQFTYTNTSSTGWHLEGTIQQKVVKIELEKINPDTTLTLLKTRRTIIIFDDYSDGE